MLCNTGWFMCVSNNTIFIELDCPKGHLKTYDSLNTDGEIEQNYVICYNCHDDMKTAILDIPQCNGTYYYENDKEMQTECLRRRLKSYNRLVEKNAFLSVSLPVEPLNHSEISEDFLDGVDYFLCHRIQNWRNKNKCTINFII